MDVKPESCLVLISKFCQKNLSVFTHSYLENAGDRRRPLYGRRALIQASVSGKLLSTLTLAKEAVSAFPQYFLGILECIERKCLHESCSFSISSLNPSFLSIAWISPSLTMSLPPPHTPPAFRP
jgi:hypothetical protein